jgi:hypothetical protein
MSKNLKPAWWDALLPVEGAGQLAIDGTTGIRVPSKIYGESAALLKRAAVMKCPQSCLQRLDDVSGGLDLRWLAPLK